MIKVSASLLAADKENIIEEVERLKINQVDYVHFDVMDNVFVPNTSFIDDTFDRIRNHTSLQFEIHLMVVNPMDYLDKYDYSNRDVIIVHYECFSCKEDIIKCLLKIKEKHKVGISIKPNTDVRVLDDLLKYLDYVLVMSVEPGFGGQKFMDSALEKISYLKKQKSMYNYVIEVDGGIDSRTASLCENEGIDIVVSGSYLFKEDMLERVKLIKCEK